MNRMTLGSARRFDIFPSHITHDEISSIRDSKGGLATRHRSPFDDHSCASDGRIFLDGGIALNIKYDCFANNPEAKDIMVCIYTVTPLDDSHKLGSRDVPLDNDILEAFLNKCAGEPNILECLFPRSMMHRTNEFFPENTKEYRYRRFLYDMLHRYSITNLSEGNNDSSYVEWIKKSLYQYKNLPAIDVFLGESKDGFKVFIHGPRDKLDDADCPCWLFSVTEGDALGVLLKRLGMPHSFVKSHKGETGSFDKPLEDELLENKNINEVSECILQILEVLYNELQNSLISHGGPVEIRHAVLIFNVLFNMYLLSQQRSSKDRYEEWNSVYETREYTAECTYRHYGVFHNVMDKSNTIEKGKDGEVDAFPHKSVIQFVRGPAGVVKTSSESIYHAGTEVKDINTKNDNSSKTVSEEENNDTSISDKESLSFDRETGCGILTNGQRHRQKKRALLITVGTITLIAVACLLLSIILIR